MQRQNLNNHFPTLDRRNFLKFSGGCAALSSTSLLSTLVNLKMTNSAMAAGGDLSGYKAMVCVFLLGGIDSFNILTPFEGTEYTDYAAARGNLALPAASLLELNSNGRKHGLHPGMPEIQELYNLNKAAFVSNVGSLVEPTTKANYSQVQKPLGLYSHSDLIQHWQTSVPQSRSQVTGWAGRMADMLTDTVNQHPTIAMNIALGSLNLFETGQNVVPYVVGTGGATTLSGYGNAGTGRDGMYTRFADDVLSQTYGDLLEKSYAKIRKGSIQAAIDFNGATSAVDLGPVVFPDTSLANQLKMVAKTIGARAALGQARQIFFVSAGGWDHHDDLLTNQAGMLPVVSQALKAFYDATVHLGVDNDVVAFTASDFARTLSSNGNGSDHAWGANHLVVGGPVAGGQVYGEYPASLALGNPLDTGRGRLIPTTSVDEYNAELACWFGMANDSTLEDVLPNIRNFYSSSNSSMPVGFLQQGGVVAAAPSDVLAGRKSRKPPRSSRSERGSPGASR